MNKFKIIQRKILPVIHQISTDNFKQNEIRRAYDLLSTRNIRVEEPNKFPPWFRKFSKKLHWLISFSEKRFNVKKQ